MYTVFQKKLCHFYFCNILWFLVNDFKQCMYFHITIQEAQLMLTNQRDSFRDQSRSPNIVSFDMLGMVTIGVL